jgi:hypothetical protein
MSAEVERAKVIRAAGLRSRGSMLAGQMSTGMWSFEPRSVRLTHCVKFSGKKFMLSMLSCYQS